MSVDLNLKPFVLFWPLLSSYFADSLILHVKNTGQCRTLFRFFGRDLTIRLINSPESDDKIKSRDSTSPVHV